VQRLGVAFVVLTRGGEEPPHLLLSPQVAEVRTEKLNLRLLDAGQCSEPAELMGEPEQGNEQRQVVRDGLRVEVVAFHDEAIDLFDPDVA
jgi:hypothetical protein